MPPPPIPVPRWAAPSTSMGIPAAPPLQQAVAAALATPGTGNIMVANDVFVSAQYLNIDGTIQSGEPDQQVTIDGTYQTLYNPDIPGQYLQREHDRRHHRRGCRLPGFRERRPARCRRSLRRHRTACSPMIIRNSCSPRPLTDNIDVYYDAPTGQLVLGQTDVQGGLVELYGDMLTTGSGNINVLDGYGAINVATTPVIPWSLPASRPAAAPRACLKITDTGKESWFHQPTAPGVPSAGHGVLSPEWTGLHEQLLRQPRRLGGFGRVAAGPVHRPERRRPHGELSAGHRAVRLGGWARPSR